MKVIYLPIVLLIGAANSERPSDEEAVMRTIESAVQLPDDAKALEYYSRNYALRPDGKVIAVYVRPHLMEARDSDYNCEVMLEDFGSRPCTEVEKGGALARDQAMAERFGQSGQSRWLEDYRDLPNISDGGCDLIEIIFDPQSQMIESTQCNGDA